MINATMAKHLWPGEDPIGQRIKVGNGTRNDWATIVGVVGDVRFSSPDAAATDEVYRPNAQQGLAFMHFVLRVSGNPLVHAADVRAAVRSLDTTVPIAELRALGDLTATANATRRTIAQLLSGFALLGLVLGMIGVYGVVSFGRRAADEGAGDSLGARRAAATSRRDGDRGQPEDGDGRHRRRKRGGGRRVEIAERAGVRDLDDVARYLCPGCRLTRRGGRIGVSASGVARGARGSATRTQERLAPRIISLRPGSLLMGSDPIYRTRN
jgi:hypothetical protein